MKVVLDVPYIRNTLKLLSVRYLEVVSDVPCIRNTLKLLYERYLYGSQWLFAATLGTVLWVPWFGLNMLTN